MRFVATEGQEATGYARVLAQNRAALLVERDVLAFAWKSVVEFVRCIGEPLTQVSNEVGTQMKEAAQTLTSLMGLNVYWESGQTEAEG